jgi:thiamine biosynthesis lipoprotein
MGTRFQVTLFADNEAAARRAADAAFDRAAALDARLSDYKPDSELMRLCARAGQGPQAVSPDLLRVLERSHDMSRRSAGAFDVTIGPVVRLWRLARRTRELPPANELRAALALVGYDKLRLNGEHRTAELLRSDMRLDLGGIAKGFAADEMLKDLRTAGCPVALVAAGGDIVAGDPPPGTDGWSVAIAPLEIGERSPRLTLRNAAVSTSGDAERFVEIAGRRYSHIVDPRTGLGLTGRYAVTVVAPDGATADAAATAAAVLGPEAGIKLADSMPGCAARFIRGNGHAIEVTASERFAKLTRE